MNLDEMRFWFVVLGQVFNGLMTAALWLYVRYGDRNKEVDHALAELTNRMTGLEQSRTGLLRHDDLEKIFQRLNGISRELSQLKGEFDVVRDSSAQGAQALAKIDGIQATLELINRHLLDKK